MGRFGWNPALRDVKFTSQNNQQETVFNFNGRPALLEFDNFYSKKHSNSIAVLYADVYSPDYIPFYFKLKELAEEGDFNFVLRYRPSSNTYPTIALSGYGVELAIKSTEYAVVDDRVVEGDSDADLKVETKDEDSLNIFNEKEPKIVKITKEAISSTC